MGCSPPYRAAHLTTVSQNASLISPNLFSPMGHGKDSLYCLYTRDLQKGGANSLVTLGYLLAHRAAQLLQQFSSWPISEFPETADPYITVFFRGALRLCCPFVKVGYTFVNEKKLKCKLSLVASGPDPVGVNLPFAPNNFML